MVSCVGPKSRPAAAWPKIEIVDPRHQRRPVAVARRHIGRERLGERAGQRLLHPGRGRIAHAGPHRRNVDFDGADAEAGLGERAPRLRPEPAKHNSSEGGERGAAGQGQRRT